MSQAAYKAINYFKEKRQLAITRQTNGTRHNNEVTVLFELKQRMKDDCFQICHALYPQPVTGYYPKPRESSLHSHVLFLYISL
jgi:hypothetical protein